MLLVRLHDLADFDHPNGRTIRFDHDSISAAAQQIADAYGEPVEEIEAQLKDHLHDNSFNILSTSLEV